MKIVIVSGGSGGHIFPALIVADTLLIDHDSLFVGGKQDILFVGGGGMEKHIIPSRGYLFREIRAGKLRRYFDLRNFIDPFWIIFGFFQSISILRKFKPDIVFAKGGYVSVPVSFAAWILRIPVVAHESDVTPGLATQIVSRFARVTCLGFVEARKNLRGRKTIVTGNIVAQSKIKNSKVKNRMPIIFITGGSLGAVTLNDKIFEILPELSGLAKIVHQVGKGNLGSAKKYARKYKTYYPVDFVENMFHELSRADLVISRSGAQNLAELSSHGKPAILFPLRSAAGDHQSANARVFERAEAAVVASEDWSNEKLILEIQKIFRSQAKQNKMSRAMKNLATPYAAVKMAAILIKNAKS